MSSAFSVGDTVTNIPVQMYNDRRKFDIGDDVFELTPSETPFLALLGKVGKQVCNDPDFKWFEHRATWLDGHYFYASDSLNITAVAAGTEDAASKLYYQKTDGGQDAVSFLRGGELLQVIDTDDVSKTALLLLHGTPGVNSCSVILVGPNAPGFNIAPGDPLLVVGKAFEEGSAKTAGYTDVLETAWGSTQIFKTFYSITNTMKQTATWGPNEYQRALSDKLREHKMNIARNFLFGFRLSGTVANPFAAPGTGDLLGTTNPLRTTLGIFPACDYSSTIQSYAGSRAFKKSVATYTFSQFIDDMEEMFEFGAARKYHFCGQSQISFFNKMSLDEGLMQISPVTEKFGINIQSVGTPAGQLQLVFEPLLRGTYQKYWGATLDMNNIKMMVLNGRETALLTHIETPGDDKQEDQYVTECGLKIKGVETHSVLRLY